MNPQKFDLLENAWLGGYVHNDNSCAFGGNFHQLHEWKEIHPDWSSEMERLAKLHGGIEFGDEDFGVWIYHKDCTKPFYVYWCVSNPRRKPNLFDLIVAKSREQKPRPQRREVNQ